MPTHRYPREIPDHLIGFGRDWPETILQYALIALVLALLAWVAVSLIRTARAAAMAPGPQPPARPDDALATVRMRYARGEVTRDEYVQASIDLGAAPPPVFRTTPPPASEAVSDPPGGGQAQP